MGKHEANPDWGAFYRIPASNPQDCHGHEKQGKIEKLSRIREGRENMTAKTSAAVWIRSSTSMENLVKSK